MSRWQPDRNASIATAGSLLGLYAADHRLDASGTPVQTANGNVLRDLVNEFGSLPLEAVEAPRHGRPDDSNPYISFDPELCILCARCTRYCDEVEGVSAIALAYRGAETTVATVADRGLLDTTCELCGGCIDTCPTGALTERRAPDLPPEAFDKTRTTCNFCGVGCQVDLNVVDGRVVKVTGPPPGETVNDGNLCVKGRFAYDFIHHPDRLREPLVRGEDGELHATTWDVAINRAAQGLMDVKKAHGPDALGICLLEPVHGRGELPDAEAQPSGVRHQQLPSVRGHVTRADGRGARDHVRRRRDDELHRRDP